jgi:hypothetical protein
MEPCCLVVMLARMVGYDLSVPLAALGASVL